MFLFAIQLLKYYESNRIKWNLVGKLIFEIFLIFTKMLSSLTGEKTINTRKNRSSCDLAKRGCHRPKIILKEMHTHNDVPMVF